MSNSQLQSWAYDEISAVPLSRRIEDDLLASVRKLTSSLSVDEVCDAVLDGTAAVFTAAASWILLHDQARDVLRTVRYRGKGSEAFQDLEVPVSSRSITALTFANREFMFVPNVAREPRWTDPAAAHASGLKSVLTVPLVAGDVSIGVLGISSDDFGSDRPPTELHIKRLELFAAQAAIGVSNARLYETSQRDRQRLRRLLQERRELRGEVSELRKVIGVAYSFGTIVGESDALKRVLGEVEQVASSDVTVLLLGETGTGKELIARAIHERSRRSSRPFVPVNCAALPDTLVESELFGHERGAFTGAVARKPGRFELANNGTLFLDEIGDLPLTAQAKLLRVLQDGRVQRLGATQTLTVNVRVIAATNQDLLARVAGKQFREDLYYRLNVFPVQLSPLRERSSDIPLLARHFVAKFCQRIGRPPPAIEPDTFAKLGRYQWPGNIRELQNVVERAVILAGTAPVAPHHVRLEDRAVVDPEKPGPQEPSLFARPEGSGTVMTLADTERAAIIQALRTARGRISGRDGAAALLALKPTTLHAKMKKLRVSRDDAFNS